MTALSMRWSFQPSLSANDDIGHGCLTFHGPGTYTFNGDDGSVTVKVRD
ncbi:hypothetical protein ACIQU6_26845 [Streptomyces sp. NPDC090442]